MIILQNFYGGLDCQQNSRLVENLQGNQISISACLQLDKIFHRKCVKKILIRKQSWLT
jgi:hypothetical protein